MRSWNIAKGHGTENDFVLVVDRHGLLNPTADDVRLVCNRRTGVGGDGLLRVIRGSHIADWAGDPTRDVRTVLQRIGGDIVHPTRYRWWHAVAFGVGINAFSRLLTGDERLYAAFKQAPFAPPAWVFGPAWGINNASVLAGNIRLLNLPSSPTRRRLLLLQAVSWLLFDAAWAQIDEPKFKGSIRQTFRPNVRTFYYLRLHGRNAAQWWTHENSEDRYNYLYTADELEPLAEAAR